MAHPHAPQLPFHPRTMDFAPAYDHFPAIGMRSHTHAHHDHGHASPPSSAYT
jgi:hypothetical protein